MKPLLCCWRRRPPGLVPTGIGGYLTSLMLVCCTLCDFNERSARSLKAIAVARLQETIGEESIVGAYYFIAGYACTAMHPLRCQRVPTPTEHLSVDSRP
jgi:hypothetical protein